MEESGYKIKVYQICSDLGELIYVGSTKNELRKRFWYHKHQSNQCASKLLFERYGIENCKIVLIEEYVVTCKAEQLRYEQYHIDMLKDRIVNKYNAHMTEDDIRAYKKTHYEANQEKIRAQNKVLYESNRKKILKQNKEYREANQEKIQARRKKYREANREKIRAQQKAHYEANREKRLKQQKAYYEASRKLK